MSKPLIILLVVLLIELSSCCHKTELTPYEKRWCKAYDSISYVVFKSNRNSFDTLYVSERYDKYSNCDCNWFEVGYTQANVMGVTLKPKNCHDTFYCDASVAISKDDASEAVYPEFGVFGLFPKWSYYNKLLVRKIKLSTTNMVYPSVYYFELGLNTLPGDAYLHSFYWDMDEGLIKYTSCDSESFELVGKWK